jgi:hypothetical protein
LRGVSVVRNQDLICDEEERRALLLSSELNGIDYIEVSAASLECQRYIIIYFIKDAPSELEEHPELFEIEGGVRIRNIKVTSVDVSGQTANVAVDKPGDFSNYTLIINSPAIDPAYARCDFSFKAGCPSRFDCKPSLICPPEPRVEPLIDYYAKDYASFRQALLDLIPTLVPEWNERHEADLGIALIELLAYVGDRLSYYQDAVANEAYLETARRRISVRRHARLVDYRMHDGASARAFVHLSLEGIDHRTLPAGTKIISRIDSPLGLMMPPHAPVIPKKLENEAIEAADVVFETIKEAQLHPSLNEIEIYTWKNQQCCLPRGTTTLDIVGDLIADSSDTKTWGLKKGEYLLFEEIKGVETGLPEDADPNHRQVVRLTSVEKISDPINESENIDITRITWDALDALTFPLCVSAELTEGWRKGEYEDNISIACGNLVLADHGRSVIEFHPSASNDPEAPGIHTDQRAYRFRLSQGPMSFRIPLPDNNCQQIPAKSLFMADPRQAEAQVSVMTSSDGVDWEHGKYTLVPDLLGSSRSDLHFVLETDNDGRGLIRFGDGIYGMQPPDGSKIKILYRVGVGRAGNVGAESLVHLIQGDTTNPIWQNIKSVSTVRNPIAAWGGVDPEIMDEVKLLAPAAFHAEQIRAVTEEDYARAAELMPEVSKAQATFRWTGSWHTVFITIDPAGRTELSPDLLEKVRSWVNSRALAGYDLEINPPIYVPLDIEILVCVKQDHFRSDVEEALLTALSNMRLPDGRLCFFHPDNFTFGEPLYLSRLYAAISAVEGVASAEVVRFVRQDEVDPEPNRPATRANCNRGFISAGRLEVFRLENDPSFPENGVLHLSMQGGK